MSITVECSACGRKYQAPDSLAGKRVRCKQCGNTFQIPGTDPSEEGPDLSALAELEKSYHSLDATGAGEHSSDDTGEEEESGGSAGPLRGGRMNVRFDFPGAKVIDEWLPTVLTVGGLLWLGFEGYRLELDDVSVNWVAGLRVLLAFFAFFVIVSPLTLAMLRRAGQRAGFRMPSGDRQRAFATFLPGFVLAYIMWVVGDGDLMPLILGCAAGLTISTAIMWLLFRLYPTEIVPAVAYAGSGFFLGMAISAGIFFGLNLLLLNVLINLKKPDLLPASPFGPGLAWISPEDKAKLLEAAAKTARTTPGGKTGPAVTTPPTTPTSSSPIVKSVESAPLTGTFDRVLHPLVESIFVGVVRKAGNGDEIQMWNSEPWSRKGTTTFAASADGSSSRYVLSPDGDHVARIASFPKLCAQVYGFGTNSTQVYYLDTTAGTPDLVGFLGPERLLVHWQQNTTSSFEVIDISTPTGTRVYRAEVFGYEQKGQSLAVNRDGTLGAIATKILGNPTLVMYNLFTGKELLRSTIASLDPKYPVSPTGMAFSPDSKRLAILFEQSGNGLLLDYPIDLANNQVQKPRENVFQQWPPTGYELRQFNGNALGWLSDSSGWVIYGYGVFSASNGQPIANLGVSGVESFRVTNPTTVEIASVPAPGSPRELTLLRLDLAKIASLMGAKP